VKSLSASPSTEENQNRQIRGWSMSTSGGITHKAYPRQYKQQKTSGSYMLDMLKEQQGGQWVEQNEQEGARLRYGRDGARWTV
jgi:hypothetical protein